MKKKKTHAHLQAHLDGTANSTTCRIFLGPVYFPKSRKKKSPSPLKLIASINWFNSWAALQKTKCRAKHGAPFHQSLLCINYPTSHRKENN